MTSQSIDLDLRDPVRTAPDLYQQLLNTLWDFKVPPSSTPQPPGKAFDRFLDLYEKTCKRSYAEISLQTHSNLISVLATCRKLSVTRDDVKKLVNQITGQLSVNPDPHSKAQQDEASILLVIKLWLMIHVSGPSPGLQRIYTVLPWEPTERLEDALSDIPTRIRTRQHSHDTTFERNFNLKNIEKYSGMKVFWTTNLLDHLLLIDSRKRVAFFHYAAFLRVHKAALDQSPFPTDLVDEALRTIALLIPRREVDDWFHKVQQKESLDPEAGDQEQLLENDRKLENFPVWGGRLLLLKEAYDDSEHQTLFQKLSDRRRDRKAWYETWFGFLGLMFATLYGLIQCIEGGIQVYKAYHPTPA